LSALVGHVAAAEAGRCPVREFNARRALGILIQFEPTPFEESVAEVSGNENRDKRKGNDSKPTNERKDLLQLLVEEKS